MLKIKSKGNPLVCHIAKLNDTSAIYNPTMEESLCPDILSLVLL